MSWLELSQILGNAGEFFGAILLFVSLIFVGMQLRQNTKAVQRSSAREAGNALAASVQIIADSAELSDIILRAFDSLESISSVERYRFECWLYGWMHAHEQEHIASRESAYLDELLAPKRRAIASHLLTSGGFQWWKERKTWFTDYFQKVVDDLLTNPPPGFETSAPSGHPPEHANPS
ncbi:MAG: hypothetical protein ACI9XK_004118 [Granulosicoccus sp.]|jgi:hypothetical protein